MATLYSDKDNFRAHKVLATAAFVDVKVNVKSGDPPKDKFPSGEVPALEHNGAAVSGDAGILWELAGTHLKGQNKDQEAEVVAWLAKAESDYAPAVLGWVLPALNLLKLEKKSVDAAHEKSLHLLKELDSMLLSRTFVVGERLSLADISLAFNLLPAFQHVLDAPARKAHQNLTRWFNTVMGQPKVVSVVGKISLCATPALASNDAAAKGGKKEEKKPKEEKKKEEKKPKAKEPEEEMDEDPELQEPKRPDPFDAFPKPSFNMDEFKRVYSNEDTATKAIPYLLTNIDWANHSIWYCEYKYPEELGLTFMSCNLISGMFQRLEKLRKYAFGSMCLFGENNASTIAGVWIWRGPELAFTLSPDWQVDFESYTWTKMDPKDAKTTETIKEFLMWEGNFGGKKFNQGKIYK